jgi:tetratricopeptide (TPR) repeat protein
MIGPDEVWLEQLETWSQAVRQHVPGLVDAPVLTISAWTAGELQGVLNDVLVLRGYLTRAAAKAARTGPRLPAPLTLSYRERVFTTKYLRGLLGLDDAPGADPNRVLKQGAMLHADIALLARVDRSRSTGSEDVVRSIDGRVVGYEGHSAHWLIGRQLLDVVEPDPAADPFVRLWYHAMSASLLESGNLAAAELHVEHALDVLPEDANIQYEGGLFHQASAAPSVQAAVQVLLEQRSTLRAGPRGSSNSFQQRFDVGKHRKEAERRFRLAVTLDPGHVEARMRLGHALLELQRAEVAATELRRTIGTTSDPTLSYLSALLLGRAEAQLGHRTAAAEQYTRAAELYPQAQSAPLALAQLARRYGDRALAWQFVGRVLAPTRPDEPRDDPWWTFYQWQLRSAETLLAELRALARSEQGP